jgi:hypothetical protein
MDIPGREQPYHFIQHIFEELEGLFVSDTDFTGWHAPNARSA